MSNDLYGGTRANERSGARRENAGEGAVRKAVQVVLPIGGVAAALLTLFYIGGRPDWVDTDNTGLVGRWLALTTECARAFGASTFALKASGVVLFNMVILFTLGLVVVTLLGRMLLIPLTGETPERIFSRLGARLRSGLLALWTLYLGFVIATSFTAATAGQPVTALTLTGSKWVLLYSGLLILAAYPRESFALTVSGIARLRDDRAGIGG